MGELDTRRFMSSSNQRKSKQSPFSSTHGRRHVGARRDWVYSKKNQTIRRGTMAIDDLFFFQKPPRKRACFLEAARIRGSRKSRAWPSPRTGPAPVRNRRPSPILLTAARQPTRWRRICSGSWQVQNLHFLPPALSK